MLYSWKLEVVWPWISLAFTKILKTKNIVQPTKTFPPTEQGYITRFWFSSFCLCLSARSTSASTAHFSSVKIVIVVIRIISVVTPVWITRIIRTITTISVYCTIIGIATFCILKKKRLFSQLELALKVEKNNTHFRQLQENFFLRRNKQQEKVKIP